MTNIHYRKAVMEMEILFAGINPDFSIQKTAQSKSTLDGIYNKAIAFFKEHIKGEDTGAKIASVLDLVVPALGFLFGGTGIGIVMTIADLVGFNFHSGYEVIKEKVKPFFNVSDGKEPNHEGIMSAITDALSTMVKGVNISDTVSGLFNLVKGGSNDGSINNLIIVKNMIANEEIFNKITKNAGLFSLLKGGILKYFAKIVFYVILAGLTALGLYTAGKATGLIDKTTTIADPPSLEEQKKGLLQLNPSLPSEITEQHINDLNHMWIIGFQPSKTEDKLKEWAKTVFNLTPEACDKSQKFSRVLDLFKKKNPGGDSELNGTIVPEQYNSIKDIVDDFAADAATKMPKPNEPTKDAPKTA